MNLKRYLPIAGFRARLLASLLIFPGLSIAQSHRILFDHLSLDDGLSHSLVVDMAEDDLGFLWFATQDGLNFFDGYEFRNFYAGKGNENTISSNWVDELYKDQYGQIWMIYRESGLDRYDPAMHRFHHYQVNPEDPGAISSTDFLSAFDLNTRHFFESSDSTLWIAHNKGLSRYQRNQDQFESLESITGKRDPLSSDSVTFISGDTRGFVWIGTYDGLYMLNPENGQIKHFLETSRTNPGKNPNIISFIHVNEDSSAWVGTVHNGLYYLRNIYQTSNTEATNFINTSLDPNYEPTIYLIYHSREDHFLFGTQQGLYYCKENDGRLSVLQVPGLPAEKVEYIIEDDFGYLWIGSDNMLRKIALEIDRTGAHITENYNIKEEYFVDDRINFLETSRNGLFWIGTEKKGLYKIDLYAKNFGLINTDPRNPYHISNNEVYSVYEDTKDHLWVGTALELNRIDLKTGSLYRFRNMQRNVKTGVSSEYSRRPDGRLVGVIHESMDHKIWMGLFDYKLSCYDPSKDLFLNFHQNEEVESAFHIWSMRTICETAAGEIYLGGTELGLCKVLEDGKSFYYFPRGNGKGPNDGWINIIIEDRDQQIWIGTLSGGMNRFDPKTGEFTYFTNDPKDRNSLSSNNVRCILEPEIGYEDILWVGTNNGLNRYDKNTGEFKTYSTDNGFPNNTILGILEDNIGKLWISTNKGLVNFDPITERIRIFTQEDGLQGNEYNEGAYFKSKTGKLYFGGLNGINYFFPDDIKENPFKGQPLITQLTINQEPVSAGDTLNGKVAIRRAISYADEIFLNRKDKILSIEFASDHLVAPFKVRYKFKMDGFEDEWHEVGARQRFANYTNLPSGHYTFMISSTNGDDTWSDSPTEISIIMSPPVWERYWFILGVLVIMFFGVLSFIRIRTRVLERQKTMLQIQVNEQTRDLQHANEILEKQKTEIQEIADKLHRSDEMKLRFFTNISHEFRTPISLMMIPLEKLILKENLNSQSIRAELALMYRNGKRLFRLITQLLEIRRIETGNLRLEIQQADIIHFVFEIFQLFIPYADKKDIDLRFICKYESMPAFFDSNKIEMIIYNLISNAIDHTPVGGKVELAIETEIPGSLHSRLLFRISDSGKGIERKYLPNIFNRFYQVPENKPSGSISAGIGLSLVKDLVTAHSGEIDVSSEVNSGTTFQVSIPFEESFYTGINIMPSKDGGANFTLNYSRSMLISPEFMGESSLKLDVDKSDRLRILFVEDNEELQQYLYGEFEENYKVYLASDGIEALDLIREKLPDLIISDVMMPKMDGIELCREVKNDVSISHIPVFLLTAKSEIESQISALETGADDYITKPFSLEVIKLKITNFFENRKQLARQFVSTDLRSIPEGLSVSPVDHGLLQHFVDFVEEHIDDSELSADDVASELNISKSSLYKKIKSLTGTSVNLFIRSIRLKVAARILKEGKYNISEVAYAVGFSNPKYFSTCFFKLFNKSPKEYMKGQ